MLELGAYAAAIADPIDRIRITIAHGTREQLFPLLGDLGIGPAAAQVLGMLRGLGPDRRVTRANVDAVHIYQQPNPVEPGLAELVSAGLIENDDTIGLTPTGVDAITRLLAASGDVVDGLWPATVDFDALLAIAARVLEAAITTPGNGLALVAPPFVPTGTPARHQFAEILTPLRFIRFDAHVGAWESEGLTVDEIQSLEPGDQRDRIEARTNEVAGAPYMVLTVDERATLLDGLRLLAP